MANVFSIESDVLPPHAMLLAFTCDEALSTLYTLRAHVMVHEAGVPGLDVAPMIGQRASVRVLHDDGSPRMSFHGVIAAAEVLQDIEGEGIYLLTLRPRVWHLTLDRHSRVFADKALYRNIRDVIKKVMTLSGLAEGVDYEFRLSRTYKAWEHICQYKETDFDFLSRWMEREGIYYFFEHGDGREKMVLIDEASSHTSIASGPKPYFPHEGHETSTIEAFQTFTARAEALPARITLRDYDYLRPTTPVQATGSTEGHTDVDVVRWGENYDTTHVRDLHGVRVQEQNARASVHRGTGRVFDLRSGYRFDVEAHPRGDMNQTYLATAVRHRGTNLSASSEALRRFGIDTTTVYAVEVTAIERDRQFRAPVITPVPRIWGVESATVDGPMDSPYAQIDAHGRYKVRVRFDELNHVDDKNSVWVRMMQPHGGNPEGFHFPLRKGTEVMLVFLGGDPDVPLIASTAPNADNPSVITSHNHTHNVIHTGSDNRLEIDDQQGAQYIDWTTPHQSTIFHLGAKTHYAWNVFLKTDGDCGFDFGTNWNIKVGGWKHEDVTGEVVETYHNIQKTTVTDLVTETYNNGQKTTITAAGQRTEVTGLVEEIYHTGQKTTITSGQTHEVSGAAMHTYKDGLTVNVTNNKTETIKTNYNLTVNGEKVESVSGTSSYIKGAEQNLILGFQSEIFCGVKHETHLIANFDLHLSLEVEGHFGPKIEAHSGIKVELRSGMDITAHAGFSLTLKEAVEVDTEGMTLKNCMARIQTTGAFTGMSSIHMFL